ncbi:hypothetical protein QJS10_CPB11g02096 [Acorus calamus]|uniref:Uncharacterized protein n=1 Tax=Acorus calamus TaxID=4465 RepID=A0AAV9DS33_ACOCL|nr:hypothetical protein QJS10_CPB11g02096 [Acorus calamus]
MSAKAICFKHNGKFNIFRGWSGVRKKQLWGVYYYVGETSDGALPTRVIYQDIQLSLHEQSIVMIVTNVFFSLIIIVFGWEPALDKGTIVDFGSAKAVGFPSSAYHLDFFSA